MKGISKWDAHALHFNEGQDPLEQRGHCDAFEEHADPGRITPSPANNAFLNIPWCWSQLCFALAYTSWLTHGE